MHERGRKKKKERKEIPLRHFFFVLRWTLLLWPARAILFVPAPFCCLERPFTLQRCFLFSDIGPSASFLTRPVVPSGSIQNHDTYTCIHVFMILRFFPKNRYTACACLIHTRKGFFPLRDVTTCDCSGQFFLLLLF